MVTFEASHILFKCPQFYIKYNVIVLEGPPSIVFFISLSCLMFNGNVNYSGFSIGDPRYFMIYCQSLLVFCIFTKVVWLI